MPSAALPAAIGIWPVGGGTGARAAFRKEVSGWGSPALVVIATRARTFASVRIIARGVPQRAARGLGTRLTQRRQAASELLPAACAHVCVIGKHRSGLPVLDPRVDRRSSLEHEDVLPEVPIIRAVAQLPRRGRMHVEASLTQQPLHLVYRLRVCVADSAFYCAPRQNDAAPGNPSNVVQQGGLELLWNVLRHLKADHEVRGRQLDVGRAQVGFAHPSARPIENARHAVVRRVRAYRANLSNRTRVPANAWRAGTP